MHLSCLLSTPKMTRATSFASPQCWEAATYSPPSCYLLLLGPATAPLAASSTCRAAACTPSRRGPTTSTAGASATTPWWSTPWPSGCRCTSRRPWPPPLRGPQPAPARGSSACTPGGWTRPACERPCRTSTRRRRATCAPRPRGPTPSCGWRTSTASPGGRRCAAAGSTSTGESGGSITAWRGRRCRARRRRRCGGACRSCAATRSPRLRTPADRAKEGACRTSAQRRRLARPLLGGCPPRMNEEYIIENTHRSWWVLWFLAGAMSQLQLALAETRGYLRLTLAGSWWWLYLSCKCSVAD
mmetsp:Transcript_1622/g.2553  ORF Transcript_1622/g.2553 Transcript_1622/m.2553 type:complete len:300 (+) Transcript_1622:423-1322(+)